MSSTFAPYKTDKTPEKKRHTRDDALSDREFELLLEGAQSLRDPYRLQTTFIVLVGGRLGLRPGEIAHMQADWVDWREKRICIPMFEPCRKGKDGGPCGYCISQAKQSADYNEVTVEEILRERWHPKTSNSAREVPFDFSVRTEMVIERLFRRYDEYPHSRVSVNRRVEKAAEAAMELEPDRVYPHALRGTAATHHAARGLRAVPLQSMMGWSSLSTAQLYIKRTGENTQRALRHTHSR